MFEVSDSGVGLEPELVERVFDLFVQGRRSLDRSEGGLGIGLTLVKRLVEMLGGRVEAHSPGPGQGSRFVVCLPATAHPPEQPAPANDTPTAATPRRVVIVEDNEDARASLRALLELQGHEVHEAMDGPSGIAAILREKPDVALVDIGLPEDRARSAEAGFDLHLVKPLDPEGLDAVLAGS